MYPAFSVDKYGYWPIHPPTEIKAFRSGSSAIQDAPDRSICGRMSQSQHKVWNTHSSMTCYLRTVYVLDVLSDRH